MSVSHACGVCTGQYDRCTCAAAEGNEASGKCATTNTGKCMQQHCCAPPRGCGRQPVQGGCKDQHLAGNTLGRPAWERLPAVCPRSSLTLLASSVQAGCPRLQLQLHCVGMASCRASQVRTAAGRARHLPQPRGGTRCGRLPPEGCAPSLPMQPMRPALQQHTASCSSTRQRQSFHRHMSRDAESGSVQAACWILSYDYAHLVAICGWCNTLHRSRPLDNHSRTRRQTVSSKAQHHGLHGSWPAAA